MFTQVADPGSPINASDFTVMIHSEIGGLATLKTKNIFCCPPIPRTLSALAKTIIPENIMRANHDQRHFIALFPVIEPEVWMRRIKEYSEEVFIKKSPWTGYIVYQNEGAKIINLAVFLAGDSIKFAKSWKTLYSAAELDAESDAETAEVEIDILNISDEIDDYKRCL